MGKYFSKKRVLVTGACGTIGSELVRQLVEEYNAGEIIGIDNNESELFFLEQKYSETNKTNFIIADIRDQEKMFRIMNGINIVFHAAALKHIVFCERSPFEAIQTNIIGLKNIINAASSCKVEKVIFTSSDKAVNPTNVMGTSKLMGERIITAANSNLKDSKTTFASTRFGNVLGSRGSVIPLFREQIKTGGPITITHPEMTRFIMSIEQASKLVIHSAQIATAGCVFITKMPVLRILDLAEIMIEELSYRYGFSPDEIKIKEIGSRPGEKMYEELMNHEETRRTIELSKYFVVKPAFEGLYRKIDHSYRDIVSEEVTNPYNSAIESKLSKSELKKFLISNSLI